MSKVWILTVCYSTTAVFEYYNYVLIYSLDPEQKDCLIEVIEKLLKDKTTVRNYFKPEMEWLHVASCVLVYLHYLIPSLLLWLSIKRTQEQEQETVYFTSMARMLCTCMLFSVESYLTANS